MFCDLPLRGILAREVPLGMTLIEVGVGVIVGMITAIDLGVVEEVVGKGNKRQLSGKAVPAMLFSSQSCRVTSPY